MTFLNAVYVCIFPNIHTKKNQRILFYINEVPINSSTKTKMIIEMFIPNLFPYFKNSAVKHHYYLVNILSNLWYKLHQISKLKCF